MDINIALQALRDPFGVPFFPWVFQFLMVFTFALHILAVNLAVGGIAIAVYEHFKGGDYNLKLSKSLAKIATIALSTAIVIGVAPLLFVQVIYDPFWYASNLLSAWWAMAFLLFVTLGFLAHYVFYLKRQKHPQSYGIFGILALLFLLAAGVVMSMLSVQALVPGSWLEWYTANGNLATTGTGFYQFKLGRFTHFIIPAFINTGIFMMLYAWYFRPRSDFDGAYLDWVGRAGVKVAKIATMIEVMIGFWWLMEIPAGLGFMRNHWLWAGSLLGFLLIFGLMKAEKEPERFAVPMALFSFVAVLGMCITREVLRMAYVGAFKYSIYDYPVNIDWGSTVLFFATFVMGLLVMAYPLIVVFKLGRGTLSES
ncbi:MAG TPA: hypothetical protein EYP64_08690 [Desulfarculaceae bacterium]|nr:hypothetical protein [Desulfarculaceae bacterium]